MRKLRQGEELIGTLQPELQGTVVQLQPGHLDTSLSGELTTCQTKWTTVPHLSHTAPLRPPCRHRQLVCIWAPPIWAGTPMRTLGLLISVSVGIDQDRNLGTQAALWQGHFPQSPLSSGEVTPLHPLLSSTVRISALFGPRRPPTPEPSV
ncbi:hypothetical protein PAL_GLEAN10004027 [Pteropus alecto]|uniref:Uncharacterized protein n=1 Tax=Pteropus alecto TaxID=9402 RepID=L5KM67_PTEAL|nr:hypothetical protein PAL_GLEAN10004027 [Pteropus alecto]